MADRPSRREFLHGSLAVAAVPLAGCVSATGPGEPPTTRNVILCMSDDQGWGDTGYNGHPFHPFLKTPNLDAMSAAGLRFDRFYSAAPVCSPTRGSTLTGRHPYRYGIPFANTGHIRDQEVTLAGNAEAERLHDGALREMAPGHPDQRPGGRPERPSRSGRVRTRVRFQSATCNKTADSSLAGAFNR